MRPWPTPSTPKARHWFEDNSGTSAKMPMSKSGPGPTDYALLATLGIFWGGSFMLIKLAVEEIPPLTMTAGRLSIASLILFVAAMAYGERITFRFRHAGLIVLVGVIGNALPFALISWGEKTVDASLAAILMGIMPITTLILAHFLAGDEKMSPRKLLGGLIGLTGLAVLVGPAVLLRLGQDGVSQLAILAAAVSYAVNAVLMKQLLGLPRRATAAWVLLAGALILVPFSVMAENPIALSPGNTALAAVCLLGVFPTAIATLVMFKVLERQGAAFFGQVNFIVPLSGVVWAALILGERPEARALIALAIVLSGIWIARGNMTSPPMTENNPVARQGNAKP